MQEVRLTNGSVKSGLNRHTWNKGIGNCHIEKNEPSHYFPEMPEIVGQCKYNGCLHDHEPVCAVKEAVENGKLPLRRYECTADCEWENWKRLSVKG